MRKNHAFLKSDLKLWLRNLYFFFSSRRRHTRLTCDWSSDVCSSDLGTRTTRSSSARTASSEHRRRLTATSAQVVELARTPCTRSGPGPGPVLRNVWKIGRASCRERV